MEKKELIRPKLGADCTQEFYDLIAKAAKADARCLSSFVRISCIERAKKILKGDEDGTD